MKRITLIAISFLVLAGAGGANADTGIEIYYIRFGVETYVPVTHDDIELAASWRGYACDSGEIAEFFLNLPAESTSTQIDRYMIRAKLIYPDGRSIVILPEKMAAI